MTPEDALRGTVDTGSLTALPPPEMDPLTEDGALREGQVQDIRVEALTSIVAVLIDMRLALHIEGANTAVLVVHGVRDFTWRTSRWKPGSMLAWNIADSVVEERNDGLFMDLDMIPNGQLTLTGHSAAFYAGDIAGGWEAPPDYGEIGTDRTHPGLAQWSSPLDLRHATFSSRWTAG